MEITGYKLAVVGGDFLMTKAWVALVSSKNTEVVSLLASIIKHPVTGMIL